jgi:hypothetical protein
MSEQPTRPNAETRDAERAEGDRRAGADRAPTSDEAERADAHAPNPDVADHEREMAERGANQEGEGRLP